jgi:hypothetical protein
MQKTIRETRPMVIDQMLRNTIILPNCKILEPSAGSGNIVDYLMSLGKNLNIDCVELNKELRQTLIDKGYNVIGNDFLELEPNPVYDLIIAAPTYKNNVDIIHIQHMYKFLNNRGRIISLTYPAWVTENSSHQREFREWLKDKNYSMRMLEDYSYIEKYETQPSLIFTLHK